MDLKNVLIKLKDKLDKKIRKMGVNFCNGKFDPEDVITGGIHRFLRVRKLLYKLEQ